MKQVAQRETRFGIVSIGIVLFALGTAFAHLYLASKPDEDLRFWFLLNGLGYLVLLGTLFLPALKDFQGIVRWLLLGYTVLTIVLWFFMGSPSEGTFDPFDSTVKAVEVLLCIMLLVDWRLASTKRI